MLLKNNNNNKIFLLPIKKIGKLIYQKRKGKLDKTEKENSVNSLIEHEKSKLIKVTDTNNIIL